MFPKNFLNGNSRFRPWKLQFPLRGNEVELDGNENYAEGEMEKVLWMAENLFK